MFTAEDRIGMWKAGPNALKEDSQCERCRAFEAGVSDAFTTSLI